MTEKLVRDKMPEVAITCNDPMNTRVASRDEFPGFLAEKLSEEADEVGVELLAGERHQLVEELADLREVIEAIMYHCNIESHEVKMAGSKKFWKKGGFLKGVIWDGTRQNSSQ